MIISMKDYGLNLIDGIKKTEPEEIVQKTKIQGKPLEEKKRGRLVFYFLMIILIVVVLFFLNSVSSSNEMLFSLSRLPIIKELNYLFNFYNSSLKGEKEDRINVLILGVGGENHEGPYLTDTIILASLKPSNKKVALLSIPRDLYVPVPGFGWQKINAANALGISQGKNGAELTSQVVSNVFEQPIHYYLTIDFNNFEKAVDLLGGLEINIEKSFKDYQFPGPNFTYRVVSFEAGPQLMDGKRVLQYVRSRHGTNNEGNDFARSARQQKVILSIKDKIVKEEILKKPGKMLELYNLLNRGIKTNLDFEDIIELGKFVLDVDSDKIMTRVLTTDKNGPLRSEIGLDGAFILKPKTGNFEDLSLIAANIFETEKEVAPSSKIIILNGTWREGLALEISEKLEGLGFEVVKIGNTLKKDYQETLIYSNSQETTDSISNLGKILNAKIEREIPINLKSEFEEGDILVVLGENQL